MPTYEPVIGLEVHAELLTRSKMFCGCPVVDLTQAEPNTAVCEICTGMPGTLPVVNRRAVEFALRVALALNCQIAGTSLFARKNYFYPDLPKGYQISQYELPLARDGWLPIQTEAGEKRVRVRRVHLEEDTGKLFHRDGYSLVDFNRSGVPLLEIVSEPDMNSVEEVYAYATALRALLRYLEVNSGDMEKGVIRFEANVSLRPAGSDDLGTRTEIKNLNSFRALTRSVEQEIERQRAILESGGQVRQQTLGWVEGRNELAKQRVKEEASDYRYFPEPDLPPLQVDPAWVEDIRAALPELPHAKRARFMEAYGLSAYVASVLTTERAVADYFEAAVAGAPAVPAERIAHWLSGELFALLNQAGQDIAACRVEPAALARLVAMVEQGRVNANSAKEVLAEMFETGAQPEAIVEARGLAQISDREALAEVVAQVLEAHPEQVRQYLEGKQGILNWLLGQVMRATRGRANPQLVRAELEAALEARRQRAP